MSSVRVDRWLCAARIYKSRSLATQACASGHVVCNGAAVKSHHSVTEGDRLEVRVRDVVRELEIVALAAKRLSAPLARELYIDHSPAPPPREPGAPVPERGLGRPTKRDRRALRKIRGRS